MKLENTFPEENVMWMLTAEWFELNFYNCLILYTGVYIKYAESFTWKTKWRTVES